MHTGLEGTAAGSFGNLDGSGSMPSLPASGNSTIGHQPSTAEPLHCNLSGPLQGPSHSTYLQPNDVLMHIIPFMVWVSGSPGPLKEFSRWLRDNLPMNETLTVISRTFAKAFIGAIWEDYRDFQAVMRLLPQDYVLDDVALQKLHEEAVRMSQSQLTDAVMHAETLIDQNLHQMDGHVSHKLFSLDLLRDTLWIVQGGSAFSEQLQRVEALLITCIEPGSTLDLARLDEIDQFCMVNYIYADIARSVAHGRSTLFTYTCDGDDSRPAKDCIGLEVRQGCPLPYLTLLRHVPDLVCHCVAQYMNGAPNTLNVALSQISNLAVIIKQSPPRSPLRTQEQHISENPDWIAQVRSIEKAVGAYSPRLLYVSERSMLNMAHLAVQEM